MHIELNKKIGPRLFTRFDAAVIRSEIELALESSAEDIHFDFSGVKMVSPSFADECFAKLLFNAGPEKIKHRIKFENVSPLIESMFSRALNERMLYAENRLT